MKKAQKGEYGYIDRQKRLRLTVIIAGLIIILADFFTGLAITKTRNNLFTIVAIVLVLPEGKFIATYLTIVKYKSAPKELFDRINSLNLSYTIVYDCLFSTKERIYMVYAAVIGTDFVLCLGKEGCDRKKFESELESFVKDGKGRVKVSLMTENKAFFNRLGQLNTAYKEFDEYEQKSIEVVKKSVLSMCI